MDDNRYEDVPKKKSFGDVMKALGRYFKNVFGSFIDSFKYNNMKLAALLVAVPGLAIGFFLIFHADTLNALDYSFQFWNEEFEEFDKYTLPQIPFDATGLAVFLIMLFGILNVFNALTMSNTKNLGSVIIATVFTSIMIILSVYYIYCVLVFKSFAFESEEARAAAGENAGIWVETAKNVKYGTTDVIQKYISKGADLSSFNTAYIPSMVSIIICDVLSVAGVVLGFINYDRTYEKVDR